MPSFHVARPPIELGTPAQQPTPVFSPDPASVVQAPSESGPSASYPPPPTAGPSAPPPNTHPASSEGRIYDPQSPLTVTQVAGLSMLGAGTLGAAWSFYRELNPLLGAHNLSKHAAIVSISYIGLREYLVLPASRLAGFPDVVKRFTENTFTEAGARVVQLRLDKMPETFVASLVAGLGLAKLHYTPVDKSMRNVGVFTLVLLTCSCQGAYNLWRAHRLRTLLGNNETLRPVKKEVKPLSQRVTEKMQAMLPLQKLTDEEYLQMLEKQRTFLDTRIQGIDMEEQALRSPSSASYRDG